MSMREVFLISKLINIRLRTKGAGHGSTSRAFYARKNLIEIIVA